MRSRVSLPLSIIFVKSIFVTFRLKQPPHIIQRITQRRRSVGIFVGEIVNYTSSAHIVSQTIVNNLPCPNLYPVQTLTDSKILLCPANRYRFTTYDEFLVFPTRFNGDLTSPVQRKKNWWCDFTHACIWNKNEAIILTDRPINARSAQNFFPRIRFFFHFFRKFHVERHFSSLQVGFLMVFRGFLVEVRPKSPQFSRFS